VDAGADIPELYNRALVQRSFQAGRYWGAGLSKLQRDDGVVWTSLTLDDRRLAEYPGRDDADLINIVSAINGAQVALVFIEQSGGKVKVSWRSQPGVDVSGVAVSFGGGGHMAAAGAEIEGKLEEVQKSVLHATRALLEHSQQAG
jgi:phosphoesterase RecJ-like protein